MHIESIGLSATAPGAGGAAGAAFTGDSLITKFGKNPRLTMVNCDYQANGFIQLAWPTAHDTTRGWRARVIASEVTPRLPFGVSLPLNPQEQITALIAGSATAGDVEQCLLQMAYDDLPGSDQRLMSWSQVQAKTEKMTTVDFSITTTAGPGWSGSEAINADSDLLIAGRDYAVLGYDVGVECLGIGLRAPETSGVRIAVPGSIEFSDLANQWFPVMSRAFGNAPMIPIINANNKANILLDAAQDENAAAVTGSMILALLR